MPALVDKVGYGKSGQATVIATLFGDMDESLYADFKKGVRGQMSPVARNPKHGIGDIGYYHTAIEDRFPSPDIFVE